jgi:hypothetical protein
MGQHDVIIRRQRQINLKYSSARLVVLVERFQRIGIGNAIKLPASVGDVYAAPIASKALPSFQRRRGPAQKRQTIHNQIRQNADGAKY